MKYLEKQKLFNEHGVDSGDTLINGCTTGILNLNEVQYSWVKGFYKVMVNNFWIPEKISLLSDKTSIKNLTDSELEAVKDTLGFLIFLDSLQVNNLPNVGDYITESGCKTLIAIQTFQEVIHTQSYQYCLESLFTEKERKDIYNRWRNNPFLLERNKFISDQMQCFIDEPTEDNFKKVLIVNLVLEGIYFYQGFNLFDQLASRRKLVGTQKMIDYIRVDEASHVGLFTKIIHEVMDTKKESQWITEIIKQAGEQEIKWAKTTYGNRILGISEKSSEDYVKHLSNKLLRGLRLDPLYDKVLNPYSHLELEERGNFFEVSGTTEYSQSASVSGWDEF